ncbi:MAG: hypothetical protein JSV00_04420 [bacterium]|nr:MAG: hypothetical protein JSV00_04420 [bacterium]
MFRKITILTAVALLLAAVAAAGTIAPGETRQAVGTISAVEPAAGAVVVEAPVEAGMLTVGVTMDKGASISRKGAAIGLGDLKVGEKVTLTYTRQGDRLVGLEIRAR